MNGSPVHLAIVDATAERSCGHDQCPRGSLYETSIANRPLIAHVLDELVAGGITHARVVARSSVRADLGRALGRGDAWGIDLSYVDAADDGTRHAVLSELERALSGDAVLLHPGDGLFGSSEVIEMRERLQVGDVDAVLPATADIDRLRFSPPRRASEAIVMLGRGAGSLIRDQLSLDDDAGDDLMAALLASDRRLAVCPGRHHWRYSETTEALLEVNRMMLDVMEASTGGDPVGENNRIGGRVAISPSAFISNCVIQGPVAIGERAVIEDSFIGPYTAIGPDAILSGAEIDNSIVLAGAEVRHAGSRIEASILGERSQVMRSFDLPTGLHLRLGPDARVILG